jgi:ketosteroid isomerase-like protein
MSRENVEVVKKFIAPPGTDYRVLFGDDAVFAAAKEVVEPLVAADFKSAFISLGPQPMEFTGLDGLRRGFLDWIAPWATYFDDLEEVFAVGDDHVVVLGREHGRRLDTGAEVVAETAGVYTVRDGKIARAEYYAKTADALEAVGRRE